MDILKRFLKFFEIQKFFHSTNHPELTGCLPFNYYHVADSSTADTTVGFGGVRAPLLTADAAGLALALTTNRQAFALAINLETYSQRSDVIISGVKTFFECNLGAQTASTYTIDFIHYLIKF